MAVPDDMDTVQKFLDEYRACCGNDPLIKRTGKNREFRENYPLSLEEIVDILRNQLTVDHCYQGPEKEDDQNRNLPGAVCKFKYPWESILIFIKLKVPEDVNLRRERTICLSFHEVGMF
ncbi:MAG: hypothetical protein D8M58_01670 [Calditrichaeota bacterium]|nr:MAG: hypothetical protein DWQ03_05410 [Calditrichota bacterium]MBL1204076.1 hypothetical protein [Calditrichota bacterium]NOG43907.1 hypothetical protein [Calditrichota bacterium]